jgi:hypothetical protein
MKPTTPPKAVAGLSVRSLAALFAIALLARLALLVAGPWTHPERALLPDSARYLLLADNLRRFGTFGKAEEDGLAHRALATLRAANGTLPPPDVNGLRPESFRTPGYSVFLAAIRMSVDDLRVVLVVQCFLGALLACAVALIAHGLGVPAFGAWLAGLLWAVHPALVLYDELILSESLFNAAAVGGLLLLTRRAPAAVLFGGVFLGLATLVRPLGFLYLPAAAVLLWKREGHRFPAIAVTVLLALAPSALWAWRNQSVGEGFRVSTVGDVNLLYYTAGYAFSEERGEDWLRSWPARVEELSAKLQQRLVPGEDVFLSARRLALDEIQARPVAVARVYAKALVKLAVDHSFGDMARLLGISYQPSGLFSRLVLRESSAAAGTSPALWATLGWVSFNLAIMIGSLVGAVVALRRRSWGLLFACLLPIALFALATGSVGLERFRLPMLLPLLVLVGNTAGARMKLETKAN